MFNKMIDLRLREQFYDNTGWDHQCALERKFPRIVQQLCRHWRNGDIDEYLDGLLIDNRGDRMGFPADVLEELIFLASIRWHLSHAFPDVMDKPHAEQFSFQAWDDTAKTDGTSRAWVLE